MEKEYMERVELKRKENGNIEIESIIESINEVEGIKWN